MATRTRSFRGISRRLARRYLENLGGRVESADRVVGDGWCATLSTRKIAIGESLTLTEVTVAFEGDEPVLESIVDAFAQKARRAGG